MDTETTDPLSNANDQRDSPSAFVLGAEQVRWRRAAHSGAARQREEPSKAGHAAAGMDPRFRLDHGY